MRAVVCFANGSYLRGQTRLKESITDCEVLTFSHYAEIGSPTHQRNPYAFKLYAIMAARKMGYKQILYLDASVFAIKPLAPLFDIIEKEGYLMQNSGWKVSQWSNDNCLAYFGITREEAEGMYMYGDAGLLGLNFDNKIANDFYNGWMKSCLAGAFVGSWKDHRHDMTCGSIVANKLGMKYREGILAYAGPNDPVDENIILKAQGM